MPFEHLKLRFTIEEKTKLTGILWLAPEVAQIHSA